jgi:hypothetical protein
MSIEKLTYKVPLQFSLLNEGMECSPFSHGENTEKETIGDVVINPIPGG